MGSAWWLLCVIKVVFDGAERFSVDLTGPVVVNFLKVQFGAIPFVLIKAIIRVLSRKFRHDTVPFYFSDNRS